MEDIDYLKSNSSKHSFIFYVDSQTRDRITYPNPNDYTIHFTSPIYNVCGLSVLDASIPRTHYNVDVTNNMLFYKIRSNSTDFDYSLEIPIGDYSSDELMNIMNELLQTIVMQYVSYPGELRKQYMFKSDFYFELDMKKSTIRNTLGFDCTYEDNIYDPIFKSKLELQYYDDVMLHTVLDNEIRTFYDLTSKTVLYVDIPNDSKDRYLEHVKLNIANVSDECTCSIKVVKMHNDGRKNIIGTKDIPINIYTTAIQTNFIEENILIGNDMYVSVHFKQFVYGDANFQCEIETQDVTNANTYVTYVTDNHLVNNTTIDQLDKLTLNIEMTGKEKKYSIISPGIYNMVGDMYINLKCKEIETHHNTQMRTYNRTDENGNIIERNFDFGIAKFKLGVNGYRDERFDFNKLPTREFHPIGKLNSLSLRFERWNGELYNFRGINHTITFNLEYYAPKIEYNERANMKSILNPDYLNNHIQY